MDRSRVIITTARALKLFSIKTVYKIKDCTMLVSFLRKYTCLRDDFIVDDDVLKYAKNLYALDTLHEFISQGFRYDSEQIRSLETGDFFDDLFDIKFKLEPPYRRVNRSLLYITDAANLEEYVIIPSGGVQIQTFKDRILQRTEDFEQTATLFESFSSVIGSMNLIINENTKTIFHGDRILVFNENYTIMYRNIQISELASRLIPVITTIRNERKSAMTILKLCKCLFGK
jgi:hypothetical protein